MTDRSLMERLEELKPFIEAHHCSTEAIDEAVALIRELRGAATVFQRAIYINASTRTLEAADRELTAVLLKAKVSTNDRRD